ncbi:GNAT family N-acetyltransferase [Paenibacillus antri]|uniref:GNAT family N-acetyltransferase n=1 Tax=Paenibacillus antri TaxID=2582848 RepID=A0A5R9FWR8_9BACL|nr:GNAT family N-acetyltransferase [Paenibacillus antri]
MGECPLTFEFLEGFDRIRGEEIDLSLAFKAPGIEEIGIVPSYIFDIVLHGTYEVVGRIDVRIGMNRNLYYGGHIGYSVEEAYRGRGFAAKACRLVRRVAVAHGMRTALITCNPENAASRKTCENIGAVLQDIVDLPPDNDMYREGERRKCVYEWKLED